MPGDYLSVDELHNEDDDIITQLGSLARDEDALSRKLEGRTRKKAPGRKRRRRDSNSSIACYTELTTPLTTVAFPEGRPMRLDMPGEDTNASYSAWQQRRAVTEEAREHYRKVQRLLTDNHVGLDMVTYNKHMTFILCVNNHIPIGISWRWISDIGEYLEYRAVEKSLQGHI